MFAALCLAGMLYGDFWDSNSRKVVVPDGGTVLSGSRVYPAYTRTESGPPILSRIPYVSRLFRTVGYQSTVPDIDSSTPIAAQPADSRVPILPALKPGERPTCDDVPTEQEIFRAMPRPSRGVSYIYEEFRDDIEITTEKLVDRIDPPRFFPLLGPAQLHHCNWKCTVSYTETVDSHFPIPFRTKRRRAEVVYIDKDRLYLCVSGNPQSVWEEMSAPQSCPAGGASAKPATKPAPAPQVQLDIVVARVNRTALPNMKFSWAKPYPDRQFQFGVLNDATGFTELLSALRADGTVAILAEPKVTTLSGRPAYFFSGGEVTIASWGSGPGESYKEDIGTKVEVRPVVKADGTVFLDISARISTLEPGAKPGIKACSASVAVEMKWGQTAAIAGLEMDHIATQTIHMPCFGDVITFPVQIKTRQEIVILVTPRLVQASVSNDPSKSMPKRVVPSDIVILQASGLTPNKGGSNDSAKGHVVGQHLVHADGTISLGKYGSVNVQGMTSGEVKTAVEKYLSAYCRNPQVKVEVKAYQRRNLSRPDGSRDAETGGAEQCENDKPSAAARNIPAESRRNDMSIADVVRMTKKGISQDIILRQMELTNAVFNLNVDDILDLHDNGVSEAIIRAMQERRTGNTAGASDPFQRMEQMLIDSENLRQMHKEWERFWRNDQPSHLTPYRIHGGVGPASPLP